MSCQQKRANSMRDSVTATVDGLLPERVRGSYLAKMLLVFAAIMLVVSATGAYQYQIATDHVHEDAQAELLETANQNVYYLQTWRAEHTKTVGILSNADELADDEEASSHLASQYATLPDHVLDLSIVDLRSGEILASTSDGAVGTTMDRVAGTSFTSASAVASTPKYEWRGESGNDVITFYSPVPTHEGRALAYTAQTAPADSLLEQASGTVTMLVSRARGIDLDTSKQHLGETYPESHSEAIEKAFAGESTVVERKTVPGLFENRQLVAYVPYHDGLVLVVHQPTPSAYALAGDVTQAIELLILATLLGFAGLAVVLSRNTAKPLQALSEKVQSLREGELDVVLSTSRTDEVGSVLGGVAALRDDLVDQRADAKQYGDVMGVAAAGDLTARMETDSNSRDMRTVATSYNDMMDEIETTVVSVRQFGDDVASLSEQVAASAAEVSEASQEVSSSIQQIADGAADQNDSLLSVVDEMNDMSASVQQIAASADELAEFTQNATATGDEGRAAATEALEGIDQIQAETESTVEEVEMLDDQMAQIGNIVDVISEIAEQTNILALNANIEAARAGEAGEGFAVVSNEVKGLAEKTQESAQQIEGLIEKLQRQQSNVLDGMSRMQERVEEGSASVDVALNSLDDIVHEVDETNASVGEIHGATSSQAESAQGILERADSAATISEETTAEAQNVSAAAEEQTASLSEVSTGVQELSNHARDLQARLDQFEVGDDVTGVSSSEPSALAPPSEPSASVTPPESAEATDARADDDASEGWQPPSEPVSVSRSESSASSDGGWPTER